MKKHDNTSGKGEGRHSVAANVIYLFGAVTKTDKLYPLKNIGFILTKLALPFLASLLPAAAVALLTDDAGIPIYLAVMGITAAVYGVGQFLGQYLDTLSGIQESAVRLIHFLPEYYHKSLTMDYCNLETDAYQLRQNEALNSVLDSTFGLEGMVKLVRSWILNLAGLLLYGGVAASLDPLIIFVLAGMVAAHYLLAWVLRKYMDKTAEGRFRMDEKLGYLEKQAEDPANGKDARLYGMEKWFGDSMRSCARGISCWFYKYLVLDYAGEASDTIFVLIRDILAYTVLVDRFLTGNLTAAGFTMSLGLIATFSRWLDAFVRDDTGLKTYSKSADNYRIFNETADVMNHGKGEPVSGLSMPPRIEFRDVSFTYPQAEKPTIRHLNLTIEPGEKIALVGVNGAGKTTLVKLLSGMYLPTEGTILVDGVPVQKFNAEEYCRLTATLYQDVNVLPFTIGENVACTDPYDRDKALDCLKKAGLWEMVEKLPKGLDTSLTQKLDAKGVQLSGGQMQKLLFARALYQDSPVLILDEPTAALDPLAEADLYEKYASHAEGRTSIFISHRLSSTQFCDRILFMEEGAVREEGTHTALLKKGGRYAKMFEVQSQYYREEDGSEEENDGILK